jgi:protein SCO1
MRVAVLAVVVACLSGATAAHAQPAPRALGGAGIDERLGAQLPLDAPFTAAGLGDVTLARVIDGDRPVLLVLAYARCSMLCSLVLRGVVDVARRMRREPRRD